MYKLTLLVLLIANSCFARTEKRFHVIESGKQFIESTYVFYTDNDVSFYLKQTQITCMHKYTILFCQARDFSLIFFGDNIPTVDIWTEQGNANISLTSKQVD